MADDESDTDEIVEDYDTRIDTDLPADIKKAMLALGAPVAVWSFYEAPEVLQKACDGSGGDEDWLALVAPGFFKAHYVPWMEEPHFGCCCVDVYWFKDGWSVRVGSHA